MNDPTYLPIIAAIISGCGLLVLLLLLFLAMALVYRYLGKEDSTMIMKKAKKGTDAFYTGQEPQSAQYLVSSMSINSFGSSPSDARLETQVSNSPGVHYNRGLDVDHHPSAGANGHEEGFKPIQIVAAADVNKRSSSTHI